MFSVKLTVEHTTKENAMRPLIPSVVMLALAGCASAPPDFTDAQRQEYRNTIPVCQTDRECELAWAEARSYVRENTPFKIRVLTDSYIETFGPRRMDWDLAYEISKKPVDNGYRIVASADCGPGIDCKPTPGTALVEFNRQVNNAMK